MALTVVRGGRSQILTAKLSEWPEARQRRPASTLTMRAASFPRMHEFMPSESRRELRVIRPDGDVENLREEIEQLRKDLDELRQELKNR